MKLYKLSFDAGFSCPNRDGKLSHGGCIFCSEGGSGDFAIKLCDKSGELLSSNELNAAIEAAKAKVSNKFKGDKYIAYFQAYTNTYASAARLRNLYTPIIKRDDIAVLSIATRPDCFNEKIYSLIEELNKIKPVWVELGLQSSNEESAIFINRGYKNEVYAEAVKRLNAIGVHTITHIILYLPNESIEDMLSSIKYALSSGSQGLKLSLLHILKSTKLAEIYSNEPFYVPTLTEYAETIKKCVEVIPENVVIHRITGDAPKKLLIEPTWSANKKLVLNTLNKAIK